MELEHKNNETFNKPFLFDYNDVRALEVFKWTAGCVFKCEITKVNLAKTEKQKKTKKKMEKKNGKVRKVIVY